MSVASFYFIPGFGSSLSDFDSLQDHLSRLLPGSDFRSLDPQTLDFSISETPRASSSLHVVIGYSMGGRIALHLAEKGPKSFDRFVLISTNPGLKTAEEKTARFASDSAWAQRFLSEPIDLVSEVWEKQSVFRGTTPKKHLFGSGKELAQTMIEWSLGKQKDYRNVSTSKPELWLFGERDQKFMSIYRDEFSTLKKRSADENGVQGQVIQNAGHRLHLDQPAKVAEIIFNWLKQHFPTELENSKEE